MVDGFFDQSESKFPARATTKLTMITADSFARQGRQLALDFRACNAKNACHSERSEVSAANGTQSRIADSAGAKVGGANPASDARRSLRNSSAPLRSE
jgi:hypothetical protein